MKIRFIHRPCRGGACPTLIEREVSQVGATARFASACWVISHLELVSAAYRGEFVRVYDALFAARQAELESYAIRSEQMRAIFQAHKRRIPILHRNGGYFLLSPGSERLRRVSLESLKRFGPYQEKCLDWDA